VEDILNQASKNCIQVLLNFRLACKIVILRWQMRYGAFLKTNKNDIRYSRIRVRSTLFTFYPIKILLYGKTIQLYGLNIQ
jgi:hypothetical protein